MLLAQLAILERFPDAAFGELEDNKMKFWTDGCQKNLKPGVIHLEPEGARVMSMDDARRLSHVKRILKRATDVEVE